MESLKTFICSHCETRFSTKLLLKRHIILHSDSQSYQCEICQSLYKYKKGLNRHLKNSHADYYNSLKLTPIKTTISIKVEDFESASSEKSVKGEENREKLEMCEEKVFNLEKLETKVEEMEPVEIARPQVVIRTGQDIHSSCIVPAMILHSMPHSMHKNLKSESITSSSNVVIKGFNDLASDEILNDPQNQMNVKTLNKLSNTTGSNLLNTVPSSDTFHNNNSSNTILDPAGLQNNSFNKVLYENYLQFSSNFVVPAAVKAKHEPSLGFVPLKEEKTGRDPKVLQMNASKRIEFLEECIRKYEVSQADVQYEIEQTKKQNEEFEIKIKKFKEKYRKMFKNNKKRSCV